VPWLSTVALSSRRIPNTCCCGLGTVLIAGGLPAGAFVIGDSADAANALSSAELFKP